MPGSVPGVMCSENLRPFGAWVVLEYRGTLLGALRLSLLCGDGPSSDGAKRPIARSLEKLAKKAHGVAVQPRSPWSGELEGAVLIRDDIAAVDEREQTGLRLF